MSSPQPTNPASNSSAKLQNKFSNDEDDVQKTKEYLQHNDFRDAITTAFNLPPNDSYIYHATASVTLAQVQQTIDAGSANGLQKWYIDEQGNSLGNPPATDIESYTSIFAPSRSAPNTLKSLAANAKKGSLRAAIAANLSSKRHLDARFSVPKRKSPHFNPALDFWLWSCQALEWGGPTEHANRVSTSHAVLPVLMHHFGCVAPSYEALELIRHVARGRAVVEVGSGGGYWAMMLRRHGVAVHAVDDGQSSFRSMWIEDTIVAEGAGWLRKRGGAREEVLLLVYPIVGGSFVERMVDAYQGGVVVVAGTQNRSGYTAFRGVGVEEGMAERWPAFGLTARVALPSFAGKDEALFVFQRG
ncbi:hypothetical protein MMC30_008409 [Trapelia coarctata]|nr:hypothetical protein [Trapelia coarctata]